MNKVKKIWYRIKQIPFIGVPYEKYIGSKRRKKLFKKKSMIVRQYGIEGINMVENVLGRVVQVYFADSGTLLGTIRDHKIIEWDPDVDYGIVIERDFDWMVLQKAMEASGFKKIREWSLNNNITEQTYQIGKLTIDIFGHFIEGDRLVSYGYQQFPGKKYQEGYFDTYQFTCPMIKGTKKEKLGPISVNVPINAEEFLSYIYDENWMIPNPDWVIFSGRGFKLLSGQQGHIKEF